MGAFAQEHGLGRVFESSCGIELPCGDTVEPDVTFISNERFRARGESSKAFLVAVPELVVEVSSPSTARRDRTTKRQIYERNGVLEYWLVDRRRERVTVLVRAADRLDPRRVYERGDAVVSTVLDGFELAVDVIFADE
jgi:Uma2 family endonuclease